MASFTAVHHDEIPGGPFRAIRAHFGVTTFGISSVTQSKDERLMSEHSEDHPQGSEEIYIVLSGRARFEIDGQTQDAPQGTLVHVPPGLKRTAFAEEDGTTVVAVGGAAPGTPYVVDGWDLFAPLFPLFEAGEYEQGADAANALLTELEEPHGSVYYNTACFESRAGRLDDAVAHLQRAIELDPGLAKLVADDEDLAAIRDRPELAEIIPSA
jgi:mannose-6-phosphate isomerase-like protein (cupin superfamily)